MAAALKLKRAAAVALGVLAPPGAVDAADGDYAELAARVAAGTARPAKGRKLGRGRTRGTKDGMNKLEKSFLDEVLIPRWRAGEIEEPRFEAIKLKLARRTFYTPDFLVNETSGNIVIYEVKGFWEEDARVKVKVAAYLYPFRFIAVTRGKTKRGEPRWLYEDFSGADA